MIDIQDIGDTVVCDFCNDDYTNSEATGGILIGSYAICPTCTPKALENVSKHKEEVTDSCPAGMTFKNWVMSLRGGNNTITILTGDDAKQAWTKKKQD